MDATYGPRSPHQIAGPWDFSFFAGAQAHPESPAADETWPGDTQMLFRTHVFFPEQLPNKPKLLDIFLLTHLNESPNPRGSNSLLAEKQPYFKVENLWPEAPWTAGGKYCAEVMQSERVECWNGHLTVKYSERKTPDTLFKENTTGTKPKDKEKRTISPHCSERER